MARSSCRTCHRNAPSQAKMPPVEPDLPKTPFEKICGDYFQLGANNYLVVVDRLSGWPEVVQVKSGSSSSGAKGLCNALRRIFATFGVPEEMSSDGGPEFVALETKDFYRRWGVKHRLSSAYFPQSNGRAELAVKTTKRLLEDNIGQNGELNTDKVVCALLQQRNTPDRDCQLSPAQILFGRPLRDGVPQLKKTIAIFDNNQILDKWHESWAAKETALRTRLVKNCERLATHSKNLEPLREGDSVLIQNQIPSSPRSKKWDRDGTVVATREHDQYLVRMARTGRLTLRNRQFLRKFQQQPVSSVPTYSYISRIPETPELEKKPCTKESCDLPDNPPQIPDPVMGEEQQEVLLSPSRQDGSGALSPGQSPVLHLARPRGRPPKNRLFRGTTWQSMAQHSTTQDDSAPNSDALPSTVNLPSNGDCNAECGQRRSTRIRKTPDFYDASSGK